MHDLGSLERGVAWTVDLAGPALTRVAGIQIRAVHVAYLEGDELVVVVRPRGGPVCFNVGPDARGPGDAPFDSAVVRLPGGVESVHRMLTASDSSILLQDRRTGAFVELTCASGSLSSGRLAPPAPGAEAWPILGRDAHGNLLLAPRMEVRREGSAVQSIRRILTRVSADSLVPRGDFRAERYLDMEGGMRPPPPLVTRFSMEARGTEVRMMSPGVPDTIYRLEEGLPEPFLSVSVDVRWPTTPADRRAWIDEELAGLGAAARGPSELLLEGLSFPAHLPSLFHVRLGSDGTTWARIWNAGAPRREFWSAFDSTGGFLGSVLAPEDVRLLAFGDEAAVAAIPDADSWTLRHLRLLPVSR